MANSINNLVNELNLQHGTMQGASSTEIEQVVNLSPFKKLPLDYLEFLATMGRYASFLRGHSCFIDELPLLNTWAKEVLIENNFPKILTQNDFVFWMSQGYMFAFFKHDKNTTLTSKIYYYSEDSKQQEFVEIANNLGEFFLKILRKDKNLFRLPPLEQAIKSSK